MNVRRKLALLLAAVVWSVVLMIPALMSAPDSDDPLAPIGPLASLGAPPPDRDEAWMLPLHRQAVAALSELQAASASHP